MGSTTRAITIFIIFVIGLSSLGRLSKALSGDLGNGATGLIIVVVLSFLLYFLNKFWEARKDQPKTQ